VGHAAGFQVSFGSAVFLGEDQLGRVGVEDAGVGDQLHAGGFRGVDCGLVLREADAAKIVGGNQQELVDAGEGFHECCGAIVVGLADFDGGGFQVLRLIRAADGGDDACRRGEALQGLDDEAAELAIGAGDGNHWKISVLARFRGVDGDDLGA